MTNLERATKLNKITMVLWACLGIGFLCIAAWSYYKEQTETLNTYLIAFCICVAMFGWKRFQLSKFGDKE